MFKKYIPYYLFNKNAFEFQQLLQKHNGEFGNDFFINKILSIYPLSELSNTVVESEYINEYLYDIGSLKFATISGIAMAKIHNFAIANDSVILGKIKDNKYDTLNNWNSVLSSPKAQYAYNIRKKAFTESNKICADHPRIMLHRDFRPHNIMCDKNSQYHLIDFEFAAKDFVGIEVMGFLGDLIKTNNWKHFITAYIKESNLSKSVIINMPDTYIRYMCTNTFPYYAVNTMNTDRYIHIVNERNERLEIFVDRLTEIKEKIENFIRGELKNANL